MLTAVSGAFSFWGLQLPTRTEKKDNGQSLTSKLLPTPSSSLPEGLLHRTIVGFRGEVAIFFNDNGVGVSENDLNLLHGHTP